ncbi:MAG: hypothetical protein QOC61_848 [Acidobacteriota bacterium]|jgi:hypothetical protein|nr:hypothetical protein [Acidobacteriota bacterium]MDT5261844.1 hypothetical protein [Acidobacteriota bacterium]MDT7780105.1 hypothetical protein [Acidobacteriota bacterium]
MRYLLSTALILAFVFSASGQVVKEEKIRRDSSRQVAETPATYFGPFKINGEKPKDFQNFDFFILDYKTDEDSARDNRDALMPDKQGTIAVRGQVVTVKGNLLDFESVRLVESGSVTTILKPGLPLRIQRAQPVMLSFTTVENLGFKYSFTGEYLDEPLEEDGAFTYLKGVLSKFKDGKLVAETKVGLVRVAYEEVFAEGNE